MSRIGNIGIDDLPPAKPRDPGPVIRNRKRNPLHPEEIQKRLRERADAITAKIGPTPYGWTIIVYAESGRVVRHTSADATYAEAKAVLDEELGWAERHGGGWIVAKRVPHQRTVLP